MPATHEPTLQRLTKSVLELREFAMPLIVVHGLYALAFWPAVMSNDSIDTWFQTVSAEFSRDHSVGYNIVAWALTRVWNSPAAIAVGQIVIVAFALSWALREIVRLGAPRRWAWVSVAAFACVPSHAVLAVSVWPDVLYSAAIAVFCVLLLKLLLRSETPLVGLVPLAPIAVAGCAIALLRPNGPPVPVVALLLLAVFQKPLRRFALWAACATVVLFLVVDRPIYHLLKVRPSNDSSGSMNPIILQTAAHMANGTEVDDADRDFLQRVYPEPKWPYACTTGMATTFAPNFNGSLFKSERGAAFAAWWHLTKRAPLVSIEHQLCMSSFVWKVVPTPMYLFGFSFDGKTPLTQHPAHQPPYVARPVEEGWPAVWPLIERIIRRSTEPFLFSLIWAPGTQLYLLLALLSVAAFRLKAPRLFLLVVPVAVNTAVIALFTGTMEYRYLHSTAVMATLALPLAFIVRPRVTPPT